MPSSDYYEWLPEDFSEQSMWRTDISAFDSGEEQRRSRWVTDRKMYSYSYPNLIDDDISDIWEFWRSRKGNYESFYLVVPPGQTHIESIAGSTDFVILTDATKPSPENITVHVDDALYSNWTYSESDKKITFGAAQSGTILVDFYELHLVRFASEIYSRDWLAYKVTVQSLDFISV